MYLSLLIFTACLSIAIIVLGQHNIEKNLLAEQERLEQESSGGTQEI